MAASSRGYGISSQDMKADRLVFVSLSNAKPRRKLAVPVPDTFTWEQFLQQVAIKLKILKVKELRLAASGERIERLEDLQDIDELYVTEAEGVVPNGTVGVNPADRSSNGPVAGPSHSTSPAGVSASPPQSSGNSMSPPLPVHPISRTISHDRRRLQAAAEAEGSPATGPHSRHEHEEDSKYARRPASFRQSLTRWLPQFFPPTLPVTNRDVDRNTSGAESRVGTLGRKRRRKRQSLAARILFLIVLMTLLGMLLYMYNRLLPRLPGIH